MTIAAEIRAKRAALEAEINAMWERHKHKIRADAKAFPERRILAAVAVAHKLSVAELRGVNRTKRYSYARHHAVWELRRRRLDLNLAQIAAQLDRTDHTTALNSYRMFAKAVSQGLYAEERAKVAEMLEGAHV